MRDIRAGSLEENNHVGENLEDLTLGEVCLDLTPKAHSTKAYVDKSDLNEIKICSRKVFIKKTE